MKRFIEPIVFASLLVGSLAGCRKAPAGTDLRADPPGGSSAERSAGSAGPGAGLAHPWWTVKPDEVVTGRYDVPSGGSVEVAGVCRVTEDGVSCWTPSGDRNPDLEKRVTWALTHPAPLAMAASKSVPGGSGVDVQRVSIALGKKNRLVIVKTSPPHPWTPDSPFVELLGVGDDGLWGDRFPLSDPAAPERVGPGGPWETMEACGVEAARDAVTVAAYVRVTEKSPKHGTLQLRNGATCSLEGASFTIESIQRGRHLPAATGGAQPNRGYEADLWTVKVRVGGQASKYRLQAGIDRGAQLRYVNGKGRLGSEKQFQDALRASTASHRRLDGRSKLPYQQVECHEWDAPGDFRYYVVNADPKLLRTLQLSASKTTVVELKDVRLDPR